ncbi:metalloregulator ArsR/SmtB family transcription factor [Yaniella flava]|uniref:Metalloregulator ArsR/SmtB family transcription factor n=2 Tax=Yaniella flava TaxID=287930 RepID=A0ABN2UAR0_9MICC
MSATQAEQVAGMLKALADPTRLRLLSHITAQGCQEVCACNLTDELGITQPTVSHHMKKLVDAGLVTREQRGKWAHYSIIPAAFDQLRTLLDLS